MSTPETTATSAAEVDPFKQPTDMTKKVYHTAESNGVLVFMAWYKEQGAGNDPSSRFTVDVGDHNVVNGQVIKYCWTPIYKVVRVPKGAQISLMGEGDDYEKWNHSQSAAWFIPTA